VSRPPDEGEVAWTVDRPDDLASSAPCLRWTIRGQSGLTSDEVLDSCATRPGNALGGEIDEIPRQLRTRILRDVTEGDRRRLGSGLGRKQPESRGLLVFRPRYRQRRARSRSDGMAGRRRRRLGDESTASPWPGQLADIDRQEPPLRLGIYMASPTVPA